ncbi:hypothetical protein [Komagataeibacter xylinus]|uniref:hypothetical protein n=1 Tax=Komagataeibacter xylinus TaxID=28448 RepID=UPI00280B7BB4|nr:hypothetical protein [Komagataeibacter xylinus]
MKRDRVSFEMSLRAAGEGGYGPAVFMVAARVADQPGRTALKKLLNPRGANAI